MALATLLFGSATARADDKSDCIAAFESAQSARGDGEFQKALERFATIVHWAHGDIGFGFASLGLRTISSIAAGVFLSNNHNRDDQPIAILGMGAIMATPTVIDAAFLSTKTVQAPKKDSHRLAEAGRHQGSQTPIGSGSSLPVLTLDTVLRKQPIKREPAR